MRRRDPHILPAMLLTLYGVVTLAGPALHALPGLGHSPTRLASDHEPAPGQPDRPAGTTHDCPICHFHAQGQLVADPDADRPLDVVRALPAPPPPRLSPPAPVRLARPRAPPLA